MNQNINLASSSSPHIRSGETTQRIMLDVAVALVPALIAAVLVFGLRALLVTLISAVSCVAFEWGYRRLLHKHCTVGDMSAVVTGILLAFCLPATIPYWMVVCGAFFAIVIVKQLFGGLGKNFLNPALAGRAFLFCWPVEMVKFVSPHTPLSLFGSNADIVSAATPLHHMVMPTLPSNSILDMFIGNIGGSIGEVSALAILIGGAYLIARKVISVRIPLSFVGTVATLTLIFSRGDADSFQWMLYSVLGGGLMLGAFFMATDYATSPVTPRGQIVYGIGCGALTVFIRYFGLYPEGVSYAILIMNACAILFDRFCAPKRFGKAKDGAGV
ncbi:MAG: RnfABCDGE type electron transport complex subunit D [Oscillospiraceae bacterium]